MERSINVENVVPGSGVKVKNNLANIVYFAYFFLDFLMQCDYLINIKKNHLYSSKDLILFQIQIV